MAAGASNTPSVSIQTAAFNGVASEIVDTVPELPSASALTHLGKARPKRPKKHAPTRGTVMSRPNEDSSFDEGMDKFYTSSANNSFSPGKPINSSIYSCNKITKTRIQISHQK